MKIAIILPVYQLEGDRWTNFRFIITKLRSVSCSEIIVVEQLKFKQETQVSKHMKDLKDIKFKYRSVISNESLVNKSLLNNKGVMTASNDTTYFWFLDVDISMPYQRVIDYLETANDMVIKPFPKFYLLTPEESTLVRNHKQISINRPARMNNSLGAGSIIIHREALYSLRGWDEAYVGWGFEDMDIALRLEDWYEPVVLQNPAVHLYHVPARLDRIYYLKNENRYKKSLTKTPEARKEDVISSLH